MMEQITFRLRDKKKAGALLTFLKSFNSYCVTAL